MRFYTSDTHFSHRNIVKFQPNRGRDDVQDMNKDIIKAWNEDVSHEDTVYHLGDVALGPVEEWNGSLAPLNGSKTLVVGNHERIFTVHNKPAYIEKWRYLYEQWFSHIYDNITGHTLSDGTVVNLSHFPYNGDNHDGDRFEDVRLEDDGTILLHGHTHSTNAITWSDKGTLQIHVGWDAWGKPVSEKTIIHLIKQHS